MLKVALKLTPTPKKDPLNPMANPGGIENVPIVHPLGAAEKIADFAVITPPAIDNVPAHSVPSGLMPMLTLMHGLVALMLSAKATGTLPDDVTPRYCRIDGGSVPDAEMPGGWLPTHGLVPRLSATPGILARPAPGLGEHNAALLRPLLGAEEFDRLSASGVIRAG